MSPKEAEFFGEWIRRYAGERPVWPLTEILVRIERIFADGVCDKEECEELRKRFGEPKSVSKADQWGVTHLRFKRGAEWIHVSLMEGTVCDILYSGLSGSEAVEMLRRQREGAKWVKSEGTGMTRWDRQQNETQPALFSRLRQTIKTFH